ncbi:GAF domain-containing protein [Candidatus Pacearchaeota archaeon]|nr:GAF domain-containing protein [Candidatus Pacearchaeota archaeon]
MKNKHSAHEGMKPEIITPYIPDATEKKRLYELALKEIHERVKGVDSLVPRMATVSSILKNIIPYYSWCGFYFAEENEMIVGPYQGTAACANIAYSGVCGTAAKNKKTVVVPNVHEFPGHITCDTRSNSEIVVPIIEDNMVIAVLDVDSVLLNAFDDIDKKFLEEKIIPILLEATN